MIMDALQQVPPLLTLQMLLSYQLQQILPIVMDSHQVIYLPRLLVERKFFQTQHTFGRMEKLVNLTPMFVQAHIQLL